MTFARSMRFSTMADQMLWPQSLARDRLTKRTQSRVVGLRLVSSLVMKYYITHNLGQVSKTTVEHHLRSTVISLTVFTAVTHWKPGL